MTTASAAGDCEMQLLVRERESLLRGNTLLPLGWRKFRVSTFVEFDFERNR